jgi:phospholipase/carboxylesterase
MTTLTGPSRPPASGVAKSAVVFLHGYGADGNDLIGLAEPMASHLPDTRFIAPNAPEACVNNPAGFQWFPIPWLDGTPESVAAEAAGRAFSMLDAWLDMVGLETPPERTALFGFSQGTMMALQVGLRRAAPFAGIVGFSGRLLRADALAAELTSPAPVLLVHGDDDPLVPVASLGEAAGVLSAAGIETRTHVSRGVGHGIAPDGFGLAVGFLRDRLGYGGVAS